MEDQSSGMEGQHESLPEINISFIDETDVDQEPHSEMQANEHVQGSSGNVPGPHSGLHSGEHVQQRRGNVPRPLRLELTAHFVSDGNQDLNNYEDEGGYGNNAYSNNESNDSNSVTHESNSDSTIDSTTDPSALSLEGSIIDLRVKNIDNNSSLRRHTALTRPQRIPFYQSISRDYSQDQTCALGLLPCGHLYHFNCIFEWVKLHKNCPNCRDSLQLDNIRVVHIKALEEKRRHSLESAKTMEQDINDLQLFVGDDASNQDPKRYRRSVSII